MDGLGSITSPVFMLCKAMLGVLSFALCIEKPNSHIHNAAMHA